MLLISPTNSDISSSCNFLDKFNSKSLTWFLNLLSLSIQFLLNDIKDQVLTCEIL